MAIAGRRPWHKNNNAPRMGRPHIHSSLSTFAAMWTVFWAARRQIKANILKIKDLGRNKIPIVLQVKQSKWKQDVRAKAAS